MHFAQSIRVVSDIYRLTGKLGGKKMKKEKRFALLGFLLLLSFCAAVVVHAANILQSYGNVEESEINIDSASVSLILTPEERETAINLVLMAPQIEDLLKTADNYTVKASEIFDIRETYEGVNLVPKPGVALVTLVINKDYGEEFGVQIVKATVDIEQKEITNTEIKPEVIKPKIIENPILPNELVENPSEYDGVVVTVSGKVSLLGEVFGSIFELDQTVTVFYAHEGATVDVSGIENGDTVTVTGKFAAPDIIYALKIEKN
jgi:hypothetical protein